MLTLVQRWATVPGPVGVAVSLPGQGDPGRQDGRVSMPPPPPADRLSAGERAVLAFARTHSGYCSNAQVRAALGLSATAYYQRLLALLDRAEAAAYDPALITRLRADRDRRRAWRTQLDRCLPTGSGPHPHQHGTIRPGAPPPHGGAGLPIPPPAPGRRLPGSGGYASGPGEIGVET